MQRRKESDGALSPRKERRDARKACIESFFQANKAAPGKAEHSGKAKRRGSLKSDCHLSDFDLPTWEHPEAARRSNRRRQSLSSTAPRTTEPVPVFAEDHDALINMVVSCDNNSLSSAMDEITFVAPHDNILGMAVRFNNSHSTDFEEITLCDHLIARDEQELANGANRGLTTSERANGGLTTSERANGGLTTSERVQEKERDISGSQDQQKQWNRQVTGQGTIHYKVRRSKRPVRRTRSLSVEDTANLGSATAEHTRERELTRPRRVQRLHSSPVSRARSRIGHTRSMPVEDATTSDSTTAEYVQEQEMLRKATEQSLRSNQVRRERPKVGCARRLPWQVEDMMSADSTTAEQAQEQALVKLALERSLNNDPGLDWEEDGEKQIKAEMERSVDSARVSRRRPRLRRTTSLSVDDTTSDATTAEYAQEQELVKLAMERSLRDDSAFDFDAEEEKDIKLAMERSLDTDMAVDLAEGEMLKLAMERSLNVDSQLHWDDDEEEQMKLAMEQSLQSIQFSHPRQKMECAGSRSESHDTDIAVDLVEVEMVKLAMERSLQDDSGLEWGEDDDEEIRLAMEQSLDSSQFSFSKANLDGSGRLFSLTDTNAQESALGQSLSTETNEEEKMMSLAMERSLQDDRHKMNRDEDAEAEMILAMERSTGSSQLSLTRPNRKLKDTKDPEISLARNLDIETSAKEEVGNLATERMLGYVDLNEEEEMMKLAMKQSLNENENENVNELFKGEEELEQSLCLDGGLDLDEEEELFRAALEQSLDDDEALQASDEDGMLNHVMERPHYYDVGSNVAQDRDVARSTSRRGRVQRRSSVHVGSSLDQSGELARSQQPNRRKAQRRCSV